MIGVPTERQTQRAILKMAAVCFPEVLLHHSPGGAHLAGNNTARFKQMGALKGDGMKVGFPDLIALWTGGLAFLEVKRPKGGKVSDEQLAMHERIEALGWPVAVIKSVPEAHSFLLNCGAPCVGELA